MEQVRLVFRLPGRLGYRANAVHEMPFNKRTLPIAEAMELAPQLRVQSMQILRNWFSLKRHFLPSK
ncbi:hypothetical protein ACTHO0_22595 [Cytobacillus praedii]|uniref:hypothetical protein n=1 Tax=Cytobacillus praedii TaxID=1742358 RepID=UPI003F7FD92A